MSRFHLILFSTFLVLLFLVSGCSTHQTALNYKEIKEFHVDRGEIQAVNLGRVEGRHRSPAWESCGYAARTALWKMISEAKKMGANAVGDLRWRDGRSPDARCKRRWGYFVFPLFYLTPAFMDAQIVATAYLVEDPDLALYSLPAEPGEEGALVERMLAGLR